MVSSVVYMRVNVDIQKKTKHVCVQCRGKGNLTPPQAPPTQVYFARPSFSLRIYSDRGKALRRKPLENHDYVFETAHG